MKAKNGITAVIATALCLFVTENRSWSSDPAKVSGKVTDPVVSRPNQKVGASVSEEEAKRFATSLELAVRAKDVAAANRQFDVLALTNNGRAGIEAEPSTIVGYIFGYRLQLMGKGSLPTQVIALCGEKGSFSPLRIHERDHHRAVLMRLWGANGASMQYIDLRLEKAKDGSVKAIDWYSFADGEPVSNAFRRGVIRAAARNSKSPAFLDKLTEAERDMVKHEPEISRAEEMLKSQRWQDAIRILNGLPRGLRQEKFLLLRRIRAARNVSTDEYSAAIGEFRQLYPDDPAIDLSASDYFATHKQVSKALAFLDHLDRIVGGDPRLHIFRAWVHVGAGDLARAEDEFEKSIAQEPACSDAYWQLLTIELDRKDFGRSLNVLKRIRTQFNFPFGDLTAKDVFKDFVASPEYQEWLRWLHSQAKETTK